MPTPLKLQAQPRVAVGRNAVRKIKTHGFVPGVIYGAKDAAQSIQLAEKDVTTLLSHVAGETVLVEVEIEGGGRKTALIQEVQHHPVTGRILHVDLHSVAMDEAIVVEVPVESTGESVGVRSGGGVLQHNLRLLEIECLPGNLPEVILVDVTELAIGASLHVRDLKLPAGVKALNDPDLTVFAVTAPTVAEEPAAPAAGAEPVVITAAKPEAGAAAEAK
ncbi:MAG: 50S ribosomal protein L25 [Verrucomicrobia bacterium]|nr:50S ribosomal protein L25 [Verrucomicrobiota bacterium]